MVPSCGVDVMKRLRNFILVGGSLLPNSARNAWVLLRERRCFVIFLEGFWSFTAAYDAQQTWPVSTAVLDGTSVESCDFRNFDTANKHVFHVFAGGVFAGGVLTGGYAPGGVVKGGIRKVELEPRFEWRAIRKRMVEYGFWSVQEITPIFGSCRRGREHAARAVLAACFQNTELPEWEW